MMKNGFYIDWTARTSLHNWHELFNLRCETSLLVGMFAGSFFLGQFFGTTALAHLGDRYGRIYVLRRLLPATFVLHAIILTFSRGSLPVHLPLLALLGFVSNLRSSSAYLYGQECTAQRDHTLVGSLFNIVDACTMIFMALGFKYVTKDWLGPQTVCLAAIGVASVISWLWMPESPVYLVRTGRY